MGMMLPDEIPHVLMEIFKENTILTHKYLDNLIPYHTYPKSWTSPFSLPFDVSEKIAGWLANHVDPDQMPYFVASELGLHCLLRPPVQIFRVNTVLPE